MKRWGLSVSLFLFPVSLACMESTESTITAQPHICVIPGLNSASPSAEYLSSLFGTTSQNIEEVPSPFSDAPFFTPSDLGQEQCLRPLRHYMENKKDDHDDIIIHATSQGTATALNYLSEDNNNSRIKGVVLEAPLASGNSAILHTLKKMSDFFPKLFGLLPLLPFSYYWLPYCAKVMFAPYWPAGKQPIKSVQNINLDLPIVLIHSKDDHQLPFSGACALYYALKSRRHQHVYFLQKEGAQHIEILNTNIINNAAESDQSVIHAILAKHGLREASANNAVDLSRYQPDHLQFKKQYDDLVFKEKIHTCLPYAALATCAATATYLLKNKIATALHKAAPIACKAWGYLKRGR